MATETEYAPTVKALADEVGRSPQALHANWLNKPGFPAKTKRGFNIAKCKAFIDRKLDEKRRSNGKSEAAEEQLQLRNMLLREKLAREQGQRMPIEDHLLEIQTHAQIVADGMRQFVDISRAKDKKLGKEAERISRRILRRLQRAIDNA
jgi:DNA-binding transcriptional MerR regulator